jgi:hypothetical protein
MALFFVFVFFYFSRHKKICIVSKLIIKKCLQMFDFVAFLLPNFILFFQKWKFSSLSSQN